MTPLELMQEQLDADVADHAKSPRTREVYLDVARRLFAGTLNQSQIRSRSRFHQVNATLEYLKEYKIIPDTETFGLEIRALKKKFKKNGAKNNAIKLIEEKVLTPEQFEDLLNALPETPQGDELRLACQIARHSGLRRFEVVSLKPDQITRLENGISIGVMGKGDKYRRVSLPLSMAYLFDGFTGFTITLQYVNMAMRRAMRKIGVKSSFHGLRHTYATEQALDGANIYELAAELGHSDINTTLIYTHVPKSIPPSKIAFWKKRGM